MSGAFDDETQKVIDKVSKLLRLASKNSNEQEAASAAAKAQEMLAEYNLTLAQVERNEGRDGKRSEERLKGGLYQWQRNLWEAVAHLNFCLYWSYKQDVAKEIRIKSWDGSFRTKTKYGYQFVHRLVGRTVNVASTQAMASYLEQAVERITREHVKDPNEYFTTYANSFREGCTRAITERIYERRRHMMSEAEKKKQDAMKAAEESGRPTSGMGTELTLSTYVDEETDANLDFLYGAGYSAKQAAERAARAAMRAQAEREHVEWAKANPEEAKRKADEEAKEKAKASRRSRGGGTGGKKWDVNAYYKGRDAGKTVSIDPQMNSGIKGHLK